MPLSLHTLLSNKIERNKNKTNRFLQNINGKDSTRETKMEDRHKVTYAIKGEIGINKPKKKNFYLSLENE